MFEHIVLIRYEYCMVEVQIYLLDIKLRLERDSIIQRVLNKLKIKQNIKSATKWPQGTAAELRLGALRLYTNYYCFRSVCTCVFVGVWCSWVSSRTRILSVQLQ